MLVIRNNSLYVDFKNSSIFVPKDTVRQTQALKVLKQAQKKLDWEQIIDKVKQKLNKKVGARTS